MEAYGQGLRPPTHIFHHGVRGRIPFARDGMKEALEDQTASILQCVPGRGTHAQSSGQRIARLFPHQQVVEIDAEIE